MGNCCCCCRRKPPDTQEQQPLQQEHEMNTIQEPEKPSEAAAEVYEVLDYVVAIYPYSANDATELSFDRGDTLEVLQKTDQDWWVARYPGHKNAGYIPAPYVAISSSLESYEWYHGVMTRMEAEQLLMSRLNSPGAFLMRKSERANAYVISVKNFSMDNYTPRVKHFNINHPTDDQFVLAGVTFLTLGDLVEYFMSAMDVGLPETIPKHPCVRPAPAMKEMSRNTKDQWEIPREQIQFVNKLGQGSFGEVWLGKWRCTWDVAIKTMKEGKMEAKDFLEEARVMKQLRHPNVLTLYGVCTEGQPLLIVTEFMPDGSLLDVLRNERLTLQLQLYVASQAAAGMEYLEGQGLIHRDLAARNILVGQCYTCKVADFGLSKHFEEAIYTDKESRGKLPIKWTAPEALLHQKYSSKSDVWSFGVMMMEIMTHGAVPYPGYTNLQVIEELLANYRMPQPASCPPKLYELILTCWKEKSEERPTFYFLHDYLQNFDVQSENSYYTTNTDRY